MALVIGAIAAIMVWGMPALQQASARSTLTGVVSQMGLLDALIDDTAEAGGGISGQGVFTYDRGGMVLAAREDPWVVVYGRGATPANLSLSGVADGDAAFTVTNEAAGPTGALAHLVAVYARVDGDRITTLGTQTLGDLLDGASVQATARDATGSAVPLTGDFLRVRFYELAVAEETLVAEAWVMDPGAVTYRLGSPGGFHEARMVQGAILVRTPFDARIERLGAVTWVRQNASDAPTVFVALDRMVPDGTGLTAGAGRWGLRVRTDHATELLPSAVRAEHLRIAVAGDDADLWQRWLRIEEPRLGTDGTAAYVDGPVSLVLFHHEVALPGGLTPR